MRFDKDLRAIAAGLLGGAVLLGGSALAAEIGQVAVYQATGASPPVDHVIRSVQVRECHMNGKDAGPAALARLSRKAASLGANGLVNVRVEVEESRPRTIKNGLPNPCLYQTMAKGDAAVLRGPLLASGSR